MLNFYHDILDAGTWEAIHSELSYHEEIFYRVLTNR